MDETAAYCNSQSHLLIISLNFFYSTENITIQCHEECLGMEIEAPPPPAHSILMCIPCLLSGGCVDPTANHCNVCRNFRMPDTGMCVNKCPDNLFVLNTFCVTAAVCIKRRRMPLLGECRQHCDTFDDLFGGTPSHCGRICPGVEIDSVSMSDLVRGCQTITGDLIIRLQSGDVNTQKYLERNLGDIEEVDGILKVHRSHVITSLSFLRNLRVIRGHNYDKSKYTIQILSNDNLQELWDFRDMKTLRLERGNLLVHYNSKLCLSQVRELQSVLGTNKSEDFVSIDSNGYEQTCLARAMSTWYTVLNHTSAEISWEKLNVTENEKIMGSIIYYIVAPDRNITHRGIDTCVQ